MCTFPGLSGYPTSWLHTQKPPIIASELTMKLLGNYVSCSLYLYISWTRFLFISICPHRQGEQRANARMLDSGQERSRWWPSILVLHLHSGSVGPAFRVDFGQFYKILQYIISYMYMYIITSQACLHPSTSRISSTPYFCLWENRSQLFKNGSWAL